MTPTIDYQTAMANLRERYQRERKLVEEWWGHVKAARAIEAELDGNGTVPQPPPAGESDRKAAPARRRRAKNGRRKARKMRGKAAVMQVLSQFGPSALHSLSEIWLIAQRTIPPNERPSYYCVKTAVRDLIARGEIRRTRNPARSRGPAGLTYLYGRRPEQITASAPHEPAG